MAISFISQASAAANSATLGTFSAGDLGIVFAFNNASTTIPSLPAGWSSPPTGTPTATGTTCAARIGFRELQGGDTTTGTWTNATNIEVIVLRGADTAIGISSAYGFTTGSSTAPNWAARTLTDANGGSWWVLMGGHRTATNMNSVALTGTTNESPAQTSLAMHDVRGTSSNWSATSKTVNQNSGWITVGIEALQATGHDRVSQTGLEAVEAPDNAKARVSQAGLESVEVSTALTARVSQAGLEIVAARTNVAIVSQVGMEVVYPRPQNVFFHAYIYE